MAKNQRSKRPDNDAKTIDGDRRGNRGEARQLEENAAPTVAAITPVTKKSYCSMTEPMMLANATWKICLRSGNAAASLIRVLEGCRSRHSGAQAIAREPHSPGAEIMDSGLATAWRSGMTAQVYCKFSATNRVSPLPLETNSTAIFLP